MAAGDGDTDELDQLGPFSRECNLTPDDLTNPVAGKVTSIKNGLVLEFVDHLPTRSTKEVADLLVALAHPDSSIHHSNPDSLRQKVKIVVTRNKKLKRNKKAAIPKFLSELFAPPVTIPAPAPPVKRTYEELERDNEEFKQRLKEAKEELKQVDEQLVLAEAQALQIADRGNYM